MRKLEREARKRIKDQGPCAFCGGPFAAHRTVDAQMLMVAAGDSLESVADAYREASVEAMVWRWYALSSILQSKAMTVASRKRRAA